MENGLKARESQLKAEVQESKVCSTWFSGGGGLGWGVQRLAGLQVRRAQLEAAIRSSGVAAETLSF